MRYDMQRQDIAEDVGGVGRVTHKSMLIRVAGSICMGPTHQARSLSLSLSNSFENTIESV